MSATNMSGTILIRENTLLPPDLEIESEVFLPGWRVVKNLDDTALARIIEGANWTFFYLAGEMRATVLGRGRAGTLRRAVKRVLAKQDEQFNSLTMRVVSKRFLGIPFVSVAAHSRHIQQRNCLVPTVPAAPDGSLGSAREHPGAELPTKQYTALTSGS